MWEGCKHSLQLWTTIFKKIIFVQKKKPGQKVRACWLHCSSLNVSVVHELRAQGRPQETFKVKGPLETFSEAQGKLTKNPLFGIPIDGKISCRKSHDGSHYGSCLSLIFGFVITVVIWQDRREVVLSRFHLTLRRPFLGYAACQNFPWLQTARIQGFLKIQSWLILVSLADFQA